MSVVVQNLINQLKFSDFDLQTINTQISNASFWIQLIPNGLNPEQHGIKLGIALLNQIKHKIFTQDILHGLLKTFVDSFQRYYTGDNVSSIIDYCHYEVNFLCSNYFEDANYTGANYAIYNRQPSFLTLQNLPGNSTELEHPGKEHALLDHNFITNHCKNRTIEEINLWLQLRHTKRQAEFLDYLRRNVEFYANTTDKISLLKQQDIVISEVIQFYVMDYQITTNRLDSPDIMSFINQLFDVHREWRRIKKEYLCALEKEENSELARQDLKRSRLPLIASSYSSTQK
jgi:hypothetical protein